MNVIDETIDRYDREYYPGSVAKVYEDRLGEPCYYLIVRDSDSWFAKLYNLKTGNPFSSERFFISRSSFTLRSLKEYIEKDGSSFKLIGIVDAELVIKEVK